MGAWEKREQNVNHRATARVIVPHFHKAGLPAAAFWAETAGMKFRHALGGLAFLTGAVLAGAAGAPDPRQKLVMLIAEPEYETAATLPAFAARFLAQDFRVVVVSAPPAAGGDAFVHLEEMADADVLLVSVRRHTPPAAQLDLIRKYVAAGKPVVGIRTACHAFALGGTDWPEWDAQVIGGHYTGHHGHGPVTHITATAAADPILRGVPVPFDSDAWFYKVSPLRPGAKPLLTGEIPGQPTEPIAWTFQRADGGATFFTSLGNPADFKNPSFQTMLRNGIRWAAGLSPSAAP
jgi:type 1 glutamine amidotransferase